MRRMGRAAFCAPLAVAAALAIGACGNPTMGPTTAAETYVYAVDTTSGNIYEIDPSNKVVSSSPIVTVGQNSSGEIRFGAGKAFVAVGNDGNGNLPGLYYFDPSSSSPSAKMVGSKTYSAQYIYIVSSTVGYVTVADYSSPANDGVYFFNPSSPSSGLTAVYTSSTSYPQDLVLSSDGYLYVANNATIMGGSTDNVLRIDFSSSTPLVSTIDLTSSGPTGIIAGYYQGNAGVFVAETGGYSAGSIDFIKSSATSVTPIISNASGKIFARAAAFSTSTLIATGGYPAKTYLVSLSGESTLTELKYNSNTSFGSMDVDILDGVAYIPDGTHAIYAVTSSGSTTKISVGSSTDGIANVGIGTIEQ